MVASLGFQVTIHKLLNHYLQFSEMFLIIRRGQHPVLFKVLGWSKVVGSDGFEAGEIKKNQNHPHGPES